MNPVPQQCRIRPMAAADLDMVLALAQSLHHAPQWPRWVYEASLDPDVPKRLALVAEATPTGALAGFVVASLIPPEAELETIAVSAEFQRRGVARQLFQALSDELRRAQITSVALEVRASNHPARALYRALGFVQAGLRPHYYADPVEDAILMGFKLT
jgi:[ribosomal protein S18]-alanine N-acetyltransferase